MIGAYIQHFNINYLWITFIFWNISLFESAPIYFKGCQNLIFAKQIQMVDYPKILITNEGANRVYVGKFPCKWCTFVFTRGFQGCSFHLADNTNLYSETATFIFNMHSRTSIIRPTVNRLTTFSKLVSTPLTIGDTQWGNNKVYKNSKYTFNYINPRD